MGARDGSRAPSVQIVGPSVYNANVNTKPQAATRFSDTDIDRAKLEALLRLLARDKVRELYRG